jgi:hypothetical protein
VSRTRRRVLIVAGVLAVVIAAAWAAEQWSKPGAEATTSAYAPGYTVKVVQAGKVLKAFSLTDLHALPTTHVLMNEKEQDGPALTAVLQAAGVSGPVPVSIVGTGLRDSGHLHLSAAQVTSKVVLDFTNRDTVKLCSPHIAQSDWVRDVTEIRVD